MPTWWAHAHRQLSANAPADRLTKFLASRGVQELESLDLPPVQLRGFDGARTTSSKGLHCCPLVPEVIPGHFQAAPCQPEVLINSEEPPPESQPVCDTRSEVSAQDEAHGRHEVQPPGKSEVIPFPEKPPPEPVKRSFQTIVNIGTARLMSLSLRGNFGICLDVG